MNSAIESRFGTTPPYPGSTRPLALITRLTLYRLSSTTLVDIGDRQRTILGTYNVSVGHLFDPTEYVGHLEAVFRVCLQVWDQYEPVLVHESDPDEGLRVELFSKLATTVFVFRGDFELALKYFVVSWNQAPLGGAENCREMYDFFFEMVFATFIAIAPFENGNPFSDPESPPGNHPWSEAEGGEEAPKLQEFQAFVEKAGAFCSYFELIRPQFVDDNRQFTEAMRSQYAQKWRRAEWLLDDVWWRVGELFRLLNEPAKGETRGAVDVEEESIVHGLPTGRTQLADRSVIDAPERTWKAELRVVFEVLAEFVRREYQDMSPDRVRFHLSKRESGATDYTMDRERDWAMYLLDRRYPRPFCVRPRERLKRFGREIALHRTLWDISARRRARQFIRLASGTTHVPDTADPIHPFPFASDGDVRRRFGIVDEDSA